VLSHPEVERRVVVLAVHHPPVNDYPAHKMFLEGLRDGAELLALLRGIPRGLILHGHLHRRIQRVLGALGEAQASSSSGGWEQLGATSASLHHEDPDRMAGFNIYELDRGGPRLARAHAHVYSEDSGSFRLESVPRHV
jgi:hypothetical protein